MVNGPETMAGNRNYHPTFTGLSMDKARRDMRGARVIEGRAKSLRMAGAGEQVAGAR